MSVNLKHSITSNGINFASNKPDKIEPKREKKSSLNNVKVAVTASALTALASIAIGVMAVKKGNVRAMAQGVEKGMKKGMKQGFKEGSEVGFKKGFDQAKKEMDEVVKVVCSKKYNEGLNYGLKVANCKLADFKSFGGKFSKSGYTTINGQPFSGTIVTPKGKIVYRFGKLQEALLNDGTRKQYLGSGDVIVRKNNKEITWHKDCTGLSKTVTNINNSCISYGTTFENGIPVKQTLESRGMRFVKNLETGKTQIVNKNTINGEDFIKTVVVDGKKVKTYKGSNCSYGYSSTYSPETKLITTQLYVKDDLGFYPVTHFIQRSKKDPFKNLCYDLNVKGEQVNIGFMGKTIESPDAKKLIGDPEFLEKIQKLFS